MRHLFVFKLVARSENSEVVGGIAVKMMKRRTQLVVVMSLLVGVMLTNFARGISVRGDEEEDSSTDAPVTTKKSLAPSSDEDEGGAQVTAMKRKKSTVVPTKAATNSLNEDSNVGTPASVLSSENTLTAKDRATQRRLANRKLDEQLKAIYKNHWEEEQNPHDHSEESLLKSKGKILLSPNCPHRKASGDCQPTFKEWTGAEIET